VLGIRQNLGQVHTEHPWLRDSQLQSPMSRPKILGSKVPHCPGQVHKAPLLMKTLLNGTSIACLQVVLTETLESAFELLGNIFFRVQLKILRTGQCLIPHWLKFLMFLVIDVVHRVDLLYFVFRGTGKISVYSLLPLVILKLVYRRSIHIVDQRDLVVTFAY